jgi:hypothetical protein
MANKLNRTAKQAFYSARQRKGDDARLSQTTGYSQSHICNVKAGRRNVPQNLANAMYNMSKRRMKNSEKESTTFVFEW